LSFKNSLVSKSDFTTFIPKEEIVIKNCLLGKIKGKDAKVITSNLTLCPETMHDKNENLLIELSKHLSKYGELVEKEAYFMVKSFYKKCPVGVLMISSDVLNVKKKMLTEKNLKSDGDNFANLFIQSVKIMQDKL
jgi:hypothetical protein